MIAIGPHRRPHNTFASSVALWTPKMIDVTAWYDPSDENSITESSGLVSQLDDLSGNGYHLTQGIGASQPLTGVRDIGGLNALNYDGSNDYLENSSLGALLDGTNIPIDIIIIVSFDNYLSNDYIATFFSSSVSNSYHLLSLDLNGNVRIYRRDDAGTTKSTNTAQSLPVSNSTPYLIESLFSGDDFTASRDGGTVSSTISGSLGSISFDGFRTGVRRTADIGLEGDLGEIIIKVGSNFSTDERQKIEGYLGHKWGVALASGHPYKNFAPTQGGN